MAGLLSETEMPPFNLMGLLLGGRGYASGWFQNRDRLKMAESAAAAERADRAAFAKGLLAGPEWGGYLKNPNDRAALGNLWGAMYGGPESAANLGSNILTSGIDAAQRREIADLQHLYQMGETQFRTDGELRLDERRRQDKADQIQAGYDYFNTPLGNGLTAAQKQLKDNQIGDLMGLRQPGYDIVRDEQSGQMIGQRPARGSPEYVKMDEQARGYSDVSSAAAEMLFELDNPQKINRGAWNQRIEDLVSFTVAKATQAGALGEGEADRLRSLFPGWKTAEFTPDFVSTAREQLRVLKYDMDKRLNEFTRASLLPLNEYRAGQFRPPEGYYPTEPPPKKLDDSTQKRIEDLRQGTAGAGGSLTMPEGYTGGGVDRGPQAPVESDAERQRRAKEELKKKFPKAKF